MQVLSNYYYYYYNYYTHSLSVPCLIISSLFFILCFVITWHPASVSASYVADILSWNTSFHTVPYSLKAKVEAELNRLLEHGIIEPVHFADWAAPIVPVLKRDGPIRICGYYKVTANRVTKLDKYPLPRIEDLFASLSG